MLKNEKFGFKRYWLSVALREVPRQPEILANKKNFNEARKTFLAGKSQLVAIENWLELGDIIAPLSPRKHQLTELGQLMLERDPQGQEAWTWWLFHLHLCANAWSCPYSMFFTTYDLEDAHWLEFDEIVKKLHDRATEAGPTVSKGSVNETTVGNYFEGVERSFRPGTPFYGLGLIERRAVDGESGKERIRRCQVAPNDIAVAYATLLFQHTLFPEQTTIETRVLLEKGLSRCLALREHEFRESLGRIHQHADLGELLQYRRQVNLDSVQFLKSGPEALYAVRRHGYISEEVQWQ
jgi:hypothetical protein